MVEASDFKFGTQLGFAKAHHKITPSGKHGGGLGSGELPKEETSKYRHFTVSV